MLNQIALTFSWDTEDNLCVNQEIIVNDFAFDGYVLGGGGTWKEELVGEVTREGESGDSSKKWVMNVMKRLP